MKATLCSGYPLTFRVGSALAGHCFRAIELERHDLEELADYAEHRPEYLLDYMRHLLTKFPPPPQE